MAEKLVNSIARTFDAYLRSKEKGNREWADNHRDRIEKLVSEYLPSGSGFDSGTKFDFDKSRPERLVFTTAFHHMDEGGGYSGWTEHTVTVTPSLMFGFNVDVSGRDRNDIKSYIGETFQSALDNETGRR